MEATKAYKTASVSAMTKDRLPTTKYDMYNKMEFLSAWRRGHSTACVLLQVHLIDSVYQNISRTSGESPAAKWRALEKIFLKKHNTQVLTNAQTA